MRIITALHLGGEGKRQIALIAVHPAREIDRCAMAAILLHLQADIAHRHLLAIFMLKKQHAIGYLQLLDIIRPAAILRNLRQRVVVRNDRRSFAAHGFGFGSQLDHRPLQHHLLNLQLMRDQRQQPDVKAHIIRANDRFCRAGRGQGHAA